MKKAVLVLADGTEIYAKGLGATTIKAGELVFNTSMTGYQEALTDPSYAGQILIMCYPLIGNYGINKKYVQSSRIWVEGFVVKWAEKKPSHYLSEENLHSYFLKNNVGCIYDLDTRKLVVKIREYGVMNAAYQIYEKEQKPDIQRLHKMVKELNYSNINFVPQVSTKKIQTIGQGNKKVVLLDYGAKEGIKTQLLKRKLKLVIMPYNSTAKEVLEQEPDGIVLSNGPGDPAILKKEIEQIKNLIGKVPIMGICLGNQLLGWAAGSKTYKLKFGHRGSNHPVLDKNLNRVLITTQNHGFALEQDSLPADWEVSHINLNDNTVEGIENKNKAAFAVQYHPEAQPGPHDSMYLFDKFVKML
ncbi:MAG: glutamine-hydrolyzing carbamoyl-phosphate synthase small subunit [Candidatus Micrarchaeota archaeon]|nr:glutamine-hydrolyzing carbamoyl-phosphate synthase small subunit [Candidatus Micrarchaeota archaeon]